MFKVYFENRYGERKFAGECNTREEIFRVVHSDLKERAPHFKSYYTRSWEKDGEIVMDVGSHVEYYIAVPE